MATTNDVVFESRLGTLIEEQGGAVVRRRISESLQISASTLSQYVRGTTRPSFERLIGLADVLEVSLDDLVFGRPAPSIEPAEAAAFDAMWDRRLGRLERRADTRTALIQRVARRLADRISTEVDDARTGRAHPGLIADEENLILESYCLHTRTVGLRLDYLVESDPGREPAAGRFLQTVARNIGEGRAYSFVLIERDDVDWSRIVNDLRRLLREVGGLPRSAIARTRFRVTSLPIATAHVIYELDVASMRREEPFLYDMIAGSCTADGHIGAMQPSFTTFGADVLMARDQLAHARRCFDRIDRSRTTQTL
ncbi:MAG: helix-turn-helix domain-containing protein [Phycisphaerales bacterium]